MLQIKDLIDISRGQGHLFGPISLPLDLAAGRCVEVDAGKTRKLVEAARN